MTKDRIVFLKIPESLCDQLAEEEQVSFAIDPDIPLPVEIPETCEEPTLENLSIEMIISAMARVIEERLTKKEWLDYYCNFILFLRPDILASLEEMTANALEDDSFERAYELISAGKAQEGLADIRAFLERHPQIWNGWFLLGWALRQLKRWQDAAAAFKKTIELGGANSDTFNELAICLMETGDIAGAQRELEAALNEDPENTKIISNLAVLALKTGDKQKAAAFFRTVLEIDKDDPVARKYLAEI